jgi:hypothetical protein
MAETVTCPLDGAVLTLPVTETRENDMCTAVVVTDPGTVHRHIRDEHPERWQEICEARQKMNASPFIFGMPRRADGCFLEDGQDVG